MNGNSQLCTYLLEQSTNIIFSLILIESIGVIIWGLPL